MALLHPRLLLVTVFLALCINPASGDTYTAGDRVSISAASTKAMAGSETLGSLPKGTEFFVEQVTADGGWLRGTFTFQGKKVSGWVKAADVGRSKAPPQANSTPTFRPDDVATARIQANSYERLIYRYDRKFDTPATLYGFLTLRQGLTETITPDVIAKNRLSVTDLMFARFPFDPSTAREAETTRLLQSLPAGEELTAILERLQKKIADGDAIQPGTSLSLIDLVKVDGDYAVMLEKLEKRLPTDAYAAAQRINQRLAAKLGVDHAQTVDSLAWVYYIRRLHGGEVVEQTHHRFLDWTRKAHGDDHPYVSRAWNNLALIRHDRGDFEAARRLLVHALQVRSTDKSTLVADVPLLLINLARVLDTEGRPAEAKRCGEISRAITRSLPVPVRSAIANSYFSEFADLRIPEVGGSPFYMRSGIAYRPSVSNFGAFGGAPGRQDNNETDSSGFDSLNMTQIIGTANRGGYVYTPFMTAGSHFMRQGDYASAERFQRQALEHARKQFFNQPDLHWHISMCYQFLGSTLEEIGNYEAALETIQEGIKIQRPLWEAEWKKAQQEFAAGRGQYFPFTAYTTYVPLLMAQAKLHTQMNRLNEAERLYREALVVALLPTSIDKNPMTEKTSHAPQCKAELADVLLRLGKTAEAEKQYREILLSDMQKWCFSFWAGVRTPRALTGLAAIFTARGTPDDLARASQMLHDAYLLVSTGQENTKGVGSNRQYTDFANALRRAGRYAEAALILDRAITSIVASRRLVGGDELNRARYFSTLTKHDPYSAMVQLQIEAGEDFKDHFGAGEFGPKAAFDYLEQGRGRALLDLMSRGGGEVTSAALTHARNLRDPALIERVEKLRALYSAARERVARIVEQGAAAAANPAQVAQLQVELKKARDAERQVNRDLFDIAKEMLDQKSLQPLTSQQAAKSLNPGEAILAYDVGADRTVLVVVWPDGRVDGEFLKWPDGKPVTETELAGTIADFFAEISREETTTNSNTTSTVSVRPPDELRKTLVPEALLEKLKACHRLFIVGDGPLHRLPFESLFLDADGEQVLLDQLPPIVYGPSATIMLHPRTRTNSAPAKNRLELVAVGDPQFTRPSGAGSGKGSTTDAASAIVRTRSLTRFGTLAPLPGTRAEIDAIRHTVASADNSNATRVKVLTGPEATLTNLFRDVDQPRFLHLATHGLAEGGRKAYDSALALAAPERVTSNDTGFLRLSDLLDQWGGKLTGTELVVLSACRTARGEMEAGDGFVALTWGFLFAGSNNVVASLWEVDDTATALLMSRFYENLLGTFAQPRMASGQNYPAGQALPRSVALQEAKAWLRNLNRADAEQAVKTLLKQEPHIPGGERPFADPFYWGAFLMFGGDEVLSNAKP